MNTEAMNTLKQINDVVNSIQIELNDKTLTSEEQALLGAALLRLTRMQDIIINNALQDMVDKINSSNEHLQKLIEDMETSTERIAKFSNTIKKISDTIGVLAEITGKAISAGIV